MSDANHTSFFYPFIFNKFFLRVDLSFTVVRPQRGGNTENLTFQAVLIMYCSMSTPPFVRVGSLHGFIFVIDITKSVKQSVQLSVVSEFAICFSELDRIFGLMPTGVVFWSMGIFRRVKDNELMR